MPRPRPAAGPVAVAACLGALLLSRADAATGPPSPAASPAPPPASASLVTAPRPPAPARPPETSGFGSPAPAAAGGGWVAPLPGAEVARGFVAPASPWGPGHRGVDLAAAPGAVVGAAGPGVVAWAGLVAGRGVVTVAHAGGLRTTYEPVAASVAPGRPVTTGTPLGVVEAAAGHCPRAVCLHWGVRLGEDYLDPMSLLRTADVVLLPFWPG